MTRRIVLIHTVSPLIEVFNRLGRALLPGVEMLHVLDEPLLERVRQQGGIQESDVERLRSHVVMAAEVGAEVVLVTCSTISQAVDGVRAKAWLPIVKIDEAMAAEAVRRGSRIGVIATNRTTLEPTRQTLMEAAREIGAHVEVELLFVPDALPALLAGDGVKHDRLVEAAIANMSIRADIVVLAQATMARVLEMDSGNTRSDQILSSPHLALEQVGRVLAQVGEHAVAAGEPP